MQANVAPSAQACAITAYMTLAILVGMKAESALAAALNWPTAIGGGTAEGATKAANTLIARGATALLSFGLAGGLDPSLPPGTLINPTHIIDGPDRYATTPGLIPWAPPTGHTLAGSDIILATAAQKSALFLVTGAAAADMESHAVARVASRHGLPFAALRAITDPAATTLPHAALIALNPDGTINLAKLLRILAQNPAQLAPLLTLARHAAAARRTLKTAIAYAPKNR